MINSYTLFLSLCILWYMSSTCSQLILGPITSLTVCRQCSFFMSHYLQNRPFNHRTHICPSVMQRAKLICFYNASEGDIFVTWNEEIWWKRVVCYMWDSILSSCYITQIGVKLMFTEAWIWIQVWKKGLPFIAYFVTKLLVQFSWVD